MLSANGETQGQGTGALGHLGESATRHGAQLCRLHQAGWPKNRIPVFIAELDDPFREWLTLLPFGQPTSQGHVLLIHKGSRQNDPGIRAHFPAQQQKIRQPVKISFLRTRTVTTGIAGKGISNPILETIAELPLPVAQVARPEPLERLHHLGSKRKTDIVCRSQCDVIQLHGTAFGLDPDLGRNRGPAIVRLKLSNDLLPARLQRQPLIEKGLAADAGKPEMQLAVSAIGLGPD